MTTGVGFDSSQQCCMNVAGATQLIVQGHHFFVVSCTVPTQELVCGIWEQGYVYYYEA